jgi:hypothetical protein
MRHCTKFSFHGELVPGICAPLVIIIIIMCPGMGPSVFNNGCVSKEFSCRVRNAISFKLTNTREGYCAQLITRCYNCIKMCPLCLCLSVLVFV